MSRNRLSERIQRSILLTAALVLLLIIPSKSTTAATVSLTMNNPVCVQPNSTKSTCAIKIRNIAAHGSDASFSQLSVFVDNKLRINMHGFFESDAYLYQEMLGNGLSVACGGPNASGNPEYGKIYSVNVTASMFDGSNASSTAVVRCPYYDGKLYLPNLIR